MALPLLVGSLFGKQGDTFPQVGCWGLGLRLGLRLGLGLG